ncbi:MAG TPA: nucleotide exchange factor GrpE [Patescibacteria group bacterium]|nr:nucleotide exchange factor GrpE [Patescibacteria group bacterium]
MKQKKQENKKENIEVEILKNQLARTLADYDNLQKRTQEEKITWIKFATEKLIQNLLPVLDGFEMAQKHLKDAGLAITVGQFKDVLKQEGLEEINPKVDETFDENTMEAIEIVEDKEKNNQIAEVLTNGWKFMDGMVVRHARVKVFKKNEAEKAS